MNRQSTGRVISIAAGVATWFCVWQVLHAEYYWATGAAIVAYLGVRAAFSYFGSTKTG